MYTVVYLETDSNNYPSVYDHKSFVKEKDAIDFAVEITADLVDDDHVSNETLRQELEENMCYHSKNYKAVIQILAN